MSWLVWCLPLVLPALYVLVGEEPASCVTAVYVPVDVVPPPCVARYVCAGWCGASPLCCALYMSWLVLYHTLVSHYVCAGECGATPMLPTMYVVVGVVPPACVARYAYSC